MKASPLSSLLIVAGSLLLAANLTAQPAPPAAEFPAASPACTLKQRVGLTDIEVVYSRPGIKNREIFGGLVPYGQVWRTGANAATKITFSTPVKLNDHAVAAGTYALFTIPDQDAWTIIINKDASQWGAYKYDEKNDVVRFKVPAAQLSEQIETFMIEFDHVRDDSAVMYLLWDQVAVQIKIEVDVASKLVPQIEAVMASGQGQTLLPGGVVLLRPRLGSAQGEPMGGCRHYQPGGALCGVSQGGNSRQAG